jgi:hypothetical protein
MRLLVFVTDDGKTDRTGPILFMREVPEAVLPPHPRSLTWRYFATISTGDALLGDDMAEAMAAMELHGYFVANRMIVPKPPSQVLLPQDVASQG